MLLSLRSSNSTAQMLSSVQCQLIEFLLHPGRSSVQPSSSAVHNEERSAGGNPSGPLKTKALKTTNKKTTKEATRQSDLEVAVKLGILDSPSRCGPLTVRPCWLVSTVVCM